MRALFLLALLWPAAIGACSSDGGPAGGTDGGGDATSRADATPQPDAAPDDASAADAASPDGAQATDASSDVDATAFPDGSPDAAPGVDGSADASGDALDDADVGPLDGAASTDGGPSDASADGAADCQPFGPYLSDASYVDSPDADAGPLACFSFVDFPCGYQALFPPTGCSLSLSDCASVCTLDGGFWDCRYEDGRGCEDASVTAQPGEPSTIQCSRCVGY